MQRTSNRLDKISDLLKRELAMLIHSEIRDPRIGMVSVTGVKVSRDLNYAEVFVTLLGKESAQAAEEGVSALNKAGGFLRSLLAKNINLRTTPKLKFRYDESVVKGQYLSGLIDKAVALESGLNSNPVEPGMDQDSNLSLNSDHSNDAD